MKFDSKIAVVTGASSGMGRALAVLLAQNNVAGLSICDVNMKDLEETANFCKKQAKHKEFKVTIYKVDVSNRANVEQWRDDVVRDFGVVDLLFNNAGINANGRMIHPPGTSKEAIETVEKNWERCFNVDFFGVVNCCRAFLPVMIEKSKEAYLVNTASVNAFWTWPEHSCYTAAKHAVKGLTDSLYIELQMKAPHVKVSCLFPGGVKTNIATSTLHENQNGMMKVAELFESRADLTSEEAAEWILNGVRRDQYRILVGYDAWLFDKMVRIGPSMVYSFYATVGRLGFLADATLVEQNRRALGPIAIARFLAAGGWYTLLFLAPVPLLQLRRSVGGKLLLGGLAAATAVGVGKISAKL